MASRWNLETRHWSIFKPRGTRSSKGTTTTCIINNSLLQFSTSDLALPAEAPALKPEVQKINAYLTLALCHGTSVAWEEW